MVFNSIHYLIFFPIVVILYFVVPKKAKNHLLLISSYYFYMSWNPAYAILIIFSTISTYLSGYLIILASNKNKRIIALVVNIIINLSILFFFKYYNFFNESIANLLAIFDITYYIPKFSFLLPVGISFYTFQALGYSIDVYRNDVKHEHNFINYALFVSFFPQLVAGPIERSKNLLPQFQRTYGFDYDRVTSGLRIILWGLFKKIVIADNLAVLVNNVYNNPTNFDGIPIIIATLAFSFQIYCDFSGYSDIAIGSARVLGFNLMKNFDRPYSSKSVKEFWTRWHISLSTWFKDYLYIPLGGSRSSTARWCLNIMIVFLVSGLWHGANWTFLIWGALHGIYLIIERLFKKIKDKIFLKSKQERTIFFITFIKWISTFIFVSFAWIFFRANTINDAAYLVKHLFVITIPGNLAELLNILLSMGCDKYLILAIVPAWSLMVIVHFIQAKYSINRLVLSFPSWFRLVVYYVMLLWMYTFGSFGQSEFIYFQF